MNYSYVMKFVELTEIRLKMLHSNPFQFTKSNHFTNARNA